MALKVAMSTLCGSPRGYGLAAVRLGQFRPPCAGGVSGDKPTLHIKNSNLGGRREGSKEFQKECNDLDCDTYICGSCLGGY